MENSLFIQILLRNSTKDEANFALDDLGIIQTVHPDYPELVQFRYDQIESSKNKTHPIVVECRGLILNSKDNWNIVAYPFNRFFNYGEVPDPIDWSTARVQEKIDGSMVFIFWYGGRWNAATKGSPSASGNVGENTFTFSELFWSVFDSEIPHYSSSNRLGKYDQSKLDMKYTYVFELTSKFNRIVTNQQWNTGNISLIGVRDITTMLEIDVARFSFLFDVVKEFPLQTVEDVAKAAEILDPAIQEGFVVVDHNFNRLKIKSPKYVMIHHLKDSLNDERMVGLIKTGEDSEVFAYFPDLKVRYFELEKKFVNTCSTLEFLYKAFSWIEDRKEFALAIQANEDIDPKFHDFFYQMKSGSVKTAKEYLQKTHDKRVWSIIND